MTRQRKLCAVGAILAVGLALAWPFRRVGSNAESLAPVAPPPADTLRASNGDPIAATNPVALSSSGSVAPSHVTAQAASAFTGSDMPQIANQLESFDIANHPALAETNVVLPASQPSISDDSLLTAQPAYTTATTDRGGSDEHWPAELLHVVANGDTLERLAERYLNDAGRALEIFDLNRDQLSNPHLLPIGVELRVPRNPDRVAD